MQRALVARCEERHCVYVLQSLDSLAELGDLKGFLARQGIVAVANTVVASMTADTAKTVIERKVFLDLLNAVQALRLPYIHLSNSRVFDSAEGNRFKESDLAAPNTEAGKTYRHLESYVRKHVDRHILLRTGALFAGEGGNILTDILRQFEQGGEIALSLQGHSAPVNAQDLARVIVALLDQLRCGVDSWPVKVWGEYHYASSDPTTCFHFAETALAVMSQYAATEHIQLSGSETVDIAWQHPLLNCKKILNTFGIKQMPWRASMVASVRAYFEGEQGEQALVGS